MMDENSSQDLYERSDTQKKTFTRWINHILKKNGKNIVVRDLTFDLQDGAVLLALLESTTGKKIKQENGRMRVHKISNVNRALQVFQGYDTKLVNIRSEEIVDGNIKLILGLVWSIILQFQVKTVIQQTLHATDSTMEVEKTLLQWCAHSVHRYKDVEIKNFTSSWRDGLAFNAILHHFKPNSFDFQKLVGKPASENLAHAFAKAQSEFNIPPLLEPEDVNTDHPDKKSIIMYVTTLFETLGKTKEGAESDGSELDQANRSDSPTPSSVSTMSEWDDYNETLTQVLTWLMQAETQLKQQEPVSENVDKVKEQFREHEEFMMILTSHQASVGSVLEFGSQLINENIVVGREEREIREQMSVLSERWENLRVSAMQRQSELHQQLMKLQQLQLQELANWLTTAENIIETTGPIGSDLESVKVQVDAHKTFQDDLENQQIHVNSLSHMVVVVDESESENATADLEEQLALLGERWSAVCKWTGNRWETLQEVLKSWEQYRNQEQRLNDWLYEKEKGLKDISLFDMGDKEEVQKQIQKLKDLENELTQQQNSFGDFNNAAQGVAQMLDEESPAIQNIQVTMEDFNKRWNTIASMLNAKMKHFRSIENNLTALLKEIDDNIEWITDTELLLKPSSPPDRELVESLDQAIKKRRDSIIVLTEQGETLMTESKNAGQSVVGLEQQLNNFQERWSQLSRTVAEKRDLVEDNEKKKVFVEQVQKILLVITEITTYIEVIVIDLKNNPTELLTILEAKQSEVSQHKAALANLLSKSNEIKDPATQAAFQSEVDAVSVKLSATESTIGDKHRQTNDRINSAPPQEFLDKMTSIKDIVNNIFPCVSKEFKYDQIKSMQTLADDLKGMVKNLQEQEGPLSLLNKQSKLLMETLSPENAEKCQKDVSELERQRADCKKITEARLKRVSEAILQTEELETAMKETVHWMDDVDRFLEEITGTISEGDAETIESQVQEVEALQQDISTVEKKVDSLIETCTLITNRAEESYAEQLRQSLDGLKKRWSGIIDSTEKQKENLRNAGEKFQQIDDGVKKIMESLGQIDSAISKEDFSVLRQDTLLSKKQEYQTYITRLEEHDQLLTSHTNTINALITTTSTTTTPPPTEQPPVCIEIEKTRTTITTLRGRIETNLSKLTSFNTDLEELKALLENVNKLAGQLKKEIVNLTSKQAGADEEILKECLSSIPAISEQIETGVFKQFDEMSTRVSKSNVCNQVILDMIYEYKSRVEGIREGCKKVQLMFEGEMKKHQQLGDDVIRIDEWVRKTSKCVLDRIDGSVDLEDDYIEGLEESISLNEDLITSTRHSIQEIQSANNQSKLDQLGNLSTQIEEIKTNLEKLKSQPSRKELERQFAALEGSVLTDIDNLKRKAKKVKLFSPEVNDIQSAVENLEELAKQCDEEIKANADRFEEIAKELSGRDDRGLDKQVQEVKTEYEKLQQFLKDREKVFADALPLSESVYAHLDTLNEWLSSTVEQLEQVSTNPLPSTPEESVEKVKSVIEDVTKKAEDVQQLVNNASSLGQMSDEPAFRAMEQRVRDVHEVYQSLLTDGDEKLDTLKQWIQQLDEYEKKVDDLNTWIDGRMSTLESIGGVTNKWEIEMETQKFESLKSMVNAKDADLDQLKAIGDELVQKGRSSVVEPYERQIYQRWDDLEKKLTSIDVMLKLKLKEFDDKEKEQEIMRLQEEKKRLVADEEVILTQSSRVVEVHAGVDIDFDQLDSGLPQPETKTDIPISSTPTDAIISKQSTNVSVSVVTTTTTTKRYEREEKVSVERDLDEMIIEIESIETMLKDLKASDENEFKTTEENAQKLEDQLNSLQPDFESLMTDAKELIKQLGHIEKKGPILDLSRRMSGAHASLAIRKKSLRNADSRYFKMKNDLTNVQVWLEETEKALRSGDHDPNKMKFIEENIERYAAEMEGVNIRAEQLSDICADSLIPKRQISLLNKKFKLVSYQLEQVQAPEEKETTYKISVETGDVENADTRASVNIKLFGEYGNSDQLQLRQSETKRKKFQRGQVDLFTFRSQPWLGKLSKLRVWHDNEGSNPQWFLASIYILDELSGRLFCFVFDSWLSKDAGAVLREIPVGAMALYKETAPDILARKHKFTEVQWLFDTLKLTSYENKMRTVEELVQDIQDVVREIEEIHAVFNDECFSKKPFDQLAQQQELLKEMETRMDSVSPSVTSLMMVQQAYINQTTPEEMHNIDVHLTTMCARWNALDKEFRHRYVSVEKNVGEWQQFTDDCNSLMLFLTKAENQLRENQNDDVEKDLYDEINRNEFKLNNLNNTGTTLIALSTDSNAELKDKLESVNRRWKEIMSGLNSRKLGSLMDDPKIKEFVNKSDQIKTQLDAIFKLVFHTKPHPVDAGSLQKYRDDLKKCENDLTDRRDEIGRLTDDADRLLERPDLSANQLDEIKSRSTSMQAQVQDLTTGHSKRFDVVENNLARATRFLDELDGLSSWMSKTRDLLEGHKENKPGYNVDPEIMKKSLETRKCNVLSINDLLKDFKAEGELASGNFPQAVGEKIGQLNVDWQIIIRLALALKERPVSEEVVVAETVQERQDAPVTFDSLQTSLSFTTTETSKYKYEMYSSTNENSIGGEGETAQLHDWLRLVEQKIKSLNVTLGDEDEMAAAVQKQNSIQLEMSNRRKEYDDAISMATTSPQDDEKINKLKEHWEGVWGKVLNKKSLINQALVDWRRYNELRLQLDNYVYKADMQLNENQQIGTTVTELEAQLDKHKKFQGELSTWANTYNTLRQLAETILSTYVNEDLNDFKTTVNETNTRWNSLETRSNAHQDSLQEALDRLLQFHKNMISALTWLSSAESKVAELDSLVESSQAEDTSNVDELQGEMQELEDDIASHQAMFNGLNETGKQILMDLEVGEVRTALQSKLDDMNDRWNSLGVRVVDIRDRMSYGTGEWRQLLLDMQEIVDWLSRAGQELMSQQPIASDVEKVQQQNKHHQEFKGKLNARRVVIEQALEQGHNFLLKHQSAQDESFIQRGDKLVVRVASSLREQLTHIQSQWLDLQNNSDKWEKTISLVLELVNNLLEDIEKINKTLNESEEIVNHWVLTQDIPVDSVASYLGDTRRMQEQTQSMETQFDSMDGTVKELRHIHGVLLAKPTEGVIDQLHDRWKHLLNDCQIRQENLQNLMSGSDAGSVMLQESVPTPWERGQALNKVPYFINHTTKTTQWDHPKMTELYHTLSELNDVKFAAYRTSMKLRCLQKACCLDLCELNLNIKKAFEQHNLRLSNDNLVDVGEIINVLSTIFESIDTNRKESINVSQCIDMTLNWLLNVYDSGRIGKLRVLSFKAAITLMSRAKLEDKWKYLFRQISDNTGHADSKKLGLLLHDCVQIPRQLGEIAAFGGSNIEPSVRSCFEMAKNNSAIDSNNFVAWTNAEPQSLVWMPVLHRLASAETAKHDAKCGICKEYPIVGFRYRCLKCFNFDLCQTCFWSGRVSKSHRVTHPMHQYSLATTTGEDLSDFVKLMRNKFKSRRYRSRPPKKLGYLPVQTIMEGSSIETPTEPTTPDLSNFTFDSTMNGHHDSTDFHPNHHGNDEEIGNEEHHLIKLMCQSLNGEITNNNTTPKSPSQILATLDSSQQEDIGEMIRGLEEEHQSLMEEYTRLKGIKPSNSFENGQIVPENTQDTVLIAEAKSLREHKGRLEARMQILEDHNRQLESQLQRLRLLLEQPPSERERHNSSGSTNPPSPKGLTPALTPSSSYHGSPELGRRQNGYSDERAMDIHHVTAEIEHAFPTSSYED